MHNYFLVPFHCSMLSSEDRGRVLVMDGHHHGPAIYPKAMQGHQQARQHVLTPPGLAQQSHSPVFQLSFAVAMGWSDDATATFAGVAMGAGEASGLVMGTGKVSGVDMDHDECFSYFSPQGFYAY